MEAKLARNRSASKKSSMLLQIIILCVLTVIIVYSNADRLFKRTPRPPAAPVTKSYPKFQSENFDLNSDEFDSMDNTIRPPIYFETNKFTMSTPIPDWNIEEGSAHVFEKSEEETNDFKHEQSQTLNVEFEKSETINSENNEIQGRTDLVVEIPKVTNVVIKVPKKSNNVIFLPATKDSKAEIQNKIDSKTELPVTDGDIEEPEMMNSDIENENKKVLETVDDGQQYAEFQRVVIHRSPFYGNFWTKRNVTYKIHDYPKALNEHYTDKIIADSFNTWSRWIPITFTQLRLQRMPMADIDILFWRAYDERTPLIFTIGYQPKNFIYINDMEIDGEDEGKSLQELMVYVIGRVLGLPWTNSETDSDSVMSGKLIFKEPQDKDISGIMSMYGPKYYLHFIPSNDTLLGKYERIR